MRSMLYDLQGGEKLGLVVDVRKGGFEAKKEGSFDSNNKPISVLDKLRTSPSSTSTSTHSYGTATAENVASLAADSTTLHQNWPELGSVGQRDEWPAAEEEELQPINPSSQRFSEGWEALLSESHGAVHQQDQSSLLRWISGDVDDTSFSLKQLLQNGNSLNEIDENAPVGGPHLTPSIFEASTPGGNLVTFPATAPYFLPFANPDQKLGLNPTQIQSMGGLAHNMFDHQFQPPQPKRHNPGFLPKTPFFDPGFAQTHMGMAHDHPQQKPPPNPMMVVVPKQEMVGAHHQQQVVYDQLYSAAELILAGNFSHAQGILARLNHQLIAPPASASKPFQRAASYFKEALQLPLLMSSNNSITMPMPPPRIPNSFDGMFKMGAYKVFSEVSPLIQFTNFTANQIILEAIGDADHIHIIDFDIGFGAQWASFMQELPSGRNNGGGGCSSSSSLKITAFASPSTHHPIELELMHENLSQFARDIGISFELEVVNFDSFDPSSFSVSGNEAIAVNFPIWSCVNHLADIPWLLRFIKQLSPRVVVSLDQGCERTDLSFPQYLLKGLQYYEVLLDSIDAANVTSDTAHKIEKFLFQPKIESMVMGRLHVPDLMPHWKTFFTSAGYSPVALSNFAETLAECLVKRTHIRGFHVEKRQASLVLCWQRRELMSASAWKC